MPEVINEVGRDELRTLVSEYRGISACIEEQGLLCSQLRSSESQIVDLAEKVLRMQENMLSNLVSTMRVRRLEIESIPYVNDEDAVVVAWASAQAMSFKS